MRTACLVAAALVAAGCGGSADRQQAGSDPSTLSADGISVDLPDGWSGRILIGASGRPVLHAASYPVEANDTDDGRIAQEAMGVNGIYLNIRALGHGDSGASLPVRFDASDFAASSLEGGPRKEAALEVASGGERFRISAVSGGEGMPPQHDLDQFNSALASLRLAAYDLKPTPAPNGNPIAGFGLHANVPEGWDGGIGRGQIHAGDSSVDVTITEFSAPDPASFVTGRIPLTIGPAEFVHQQGGSGFETGRSFLDAGRQFQLWVRAPEPPADVELERVNALLASFHADPGDFYPGRVDPATFVAADDWDTGSTGPAEIRPDGQQTRSWASTIPYRDSGLQFPPHETLEALPPEGIIVLVTLEQHSRLGDDPISQLPRLSDFLEGRFEGIPENNSTRHFNANEGHYSADMWVLFGRDHPTPEQLDRAQAELNRLKLPEWPGWDATSGAR